MKNMGCVAVIEYATGGGFSREALNPLLFPEGYGMLRAVIEDLKRGGYRVITTLDARLKPFCRLPADEEVIIAPGEDLITKLTSHLDTIDGALIIAPALNNALYKLTRFFEDRGVKLLGAGSEATRVASDKWLTYLALREAGIPVPVTLVADLDEDPELLAQEIEELGYPVVFKPVDGASCAGLCLVEKPSHVESALRRLQMETGRKQFLIQEYLPGLHSSVSLICDGRKAFPLSLNAQYIKLSTPEANSKYEGGYVPMEHLLAKEARNIAKGAVEAIPDLKGYVGVDLVLTERGPIVVEVNPRLTTTYLGLRKVLKINLSEAIIHAAFGEEMPEETGFAGVAFIAHIYFGETLPLTDEAARAIEELSEVMSPPFPIAGHLEPGETGALVVTHGDNLDKAQQRFHEVKQRIYSLLKTPPTTTRNQPSLTCSL